MGGPGPVEVHRKGSIEVHCPAGSKDHAKKNPMSMEFTNQIDITAGSPEPLLPCMGRSIGDLLHEEVKGSKWVEHKWAWIGLHSN